MYVLSISAPSGQHTGVGGHTDSSKTGHTGGGITIERGLGGGELDGNETRIGLVLVGGRGRGGKRGLGICGGVGLSGGVGLCGGVVGRGVVGLVGLDAGGLVRDLVGASVDLVGADVGADVVGALVGALVGGLVITTMLSPLSSTAGGISQSSLNNPQSTTENIHWFDVHVTVKGYRLQHS